VASVGKWPIAVVGLCLSPELWVGLCYCRTPCEHTRTQQTSAKTLL